MAHVTNLTPFFALIYLFAQVQQLSAGGEGFPDWFPDWNMNPFQRGNNQRSEQLCKQRSMDCKAKGPLAPRLQAKVIGSTTLSPEADLIANYDLNMDNCITPSEFITLSTSRGFSVVYARYMLDARLKSGVGVNNAVCPGGISIKSLRALPNPGVVNAVTINANMVKALIAFCDLDTTGKLYQTNCDCIQLPTVCQNLPFQTTPACINFKIRYISKNYCPFSVTMDIAATQALCATGRFNHPRLAPLIRSLCTLLNQRASTSTVG